MTIAELNRAVEAKKRIQKEDLKIRASFDYILADLIGKSISRLYSSSASMPTLADAYPSLFSNEEIEEKIQKQKEELYSIRIKQFAQSFNNRFKEVGKP